MAIYTNEIEYDMEAKRGYKPTIETIVPPTPKHGNASLQHRIMAYSFNQWLLQNKGMRTRDIRIGGGDEEAAKCGMAHIYHVANKRTAVLCARIRCDRNDTADSLHRRDAKQTKSPLCKRCDGHSIINEKQSMNADEAYVRALEIDGGMATTTTTSTAPSNATTTTKSATKRAKKLCKINNMDVIIKSSTNPLINHPIDTIHHYIYECIATQHIRNKHDIDEKISIYELLGSTNDTNTATHKNNDNEALMHKYMDYFDDMYVECTI